MGFKMNSKLKQEDIQLIKDSASDFLGVDVSFDSEVQCDVVRYPDGKISIIPTDNTTEEQLAEAVKKYTKESV